MKISLICPVWNTPRKLFRACLGSVMNLEGATTDNFEAIFIDDGSTDGSGRLLDGAVEKCPWMRVIHQPNRGNCVARNMGIMHSTGDYVAFLDCDDYLYPGFLQNALRTVSSGKDVYQFNIYKKREKDDPTLYPMWPHSYGDCAFPPTESPTWVYAWAKLIRRGFLIGHDVRFPDPKDVPSLYRGELRNYVRGEDNYFCARLLYEAGRAHLVPWFGVVHVIRQSSLGRRVVSSEDNGMLGLYLVYRALYNEADTKGDTPLARYAMDMMRLYWGLADKSRCPDGWKLE